MPYSTYLTIHALRYMRYDTPVRYHEVASSIMLLCIHTLVGAMKACRNQPLMRVYASELDGWDADMSCACISCGCISYACMSCACMSVMCMHVMCMYFKSYGCMSSHFDASHYQISMHLMPTPLLHTHPHRRLHLYPPTSIPTTPPACAQAIQSARCRVTRVA